MKRARELAATAVADYKKRKKAAALSPGSGKTSTAQHATATTKPASKAKPAKANPAKKTSATPRRSKAKVRKR
jgi:hypothetical protein